MSKAAPAAAPTLEELNAQRDERIDKLRAAQATLDDLRGRSYRAGGDVEKGLASQAEADAIEVDAAAAEKHFNRVRAALERDEEELREAEQVARADHLAAVRSECEQAAGEVTAAELRIRRAIGEAVNAAVGQRDRAKATRRRTLAQIRANPVVAAKAEQIVAAQRAALGDAEADYQAAYAAAATSGAAPISEKSPHGTEIVRGWSKSLVKVQEDRAIAWQVRNAAIEKAVADRAAALAALGLVDDDDDDASLAKLAQEWRPMLRRFEPPEHLQAITRLIQIARESTTNPTVILQGERRAERALEVIELTRLASL